MVDQWRPAARNLSEGDDPAGKLSDEMICPVDSFFWRQYQLPCRHLWHYQIVFDSFKASHWEIWAERFEDSGFEVYETSARLDVEYEEIEAPDRHRLQVREVLDTMKDKFYEVMEYTADWEEEERNDGIVRWLGWLKKLTGPITSKGVEEALQEISEEKARRATSWWAKRRREGE